jgi:predicted nuclease with TOPRIM domain
MPCYTPDPTPQEIALNERIHNKEKYEFSLTDSELITHLLNMCCEMGGTLEAEGIEDRLTPDTRQWYMQHKKRDAEKRKREMINKLSLKTAKYAEIRSNLNDLETEIEQLKSELNEVYDDLAQIR